MNKLTKKLTTQDVFKSIWMDFLYPINNTNTRTIDWILSQDIQNQQSLFCIELAEQLAESAPKSNKLPFVLERSFTGTILKMQNPPAQLFYNWLVQQNAIAVNPDQVDPSPFLATFKIGNCDHVQNKKSRYEVSENAKILYSIASDMNLHRANFTGNPLSIIGADGLLEGDLINCLVTRLREATKRGAFKSKVAERKKASTYTLTKTKHFLDDLYANRPCLYGVSMVLCYQSEYAKKITLKESAEHIMEYFKAFDTGLTHGSPVGWWWKREYMTEMGYRYSLIFFLDGQKNPYNSMEIQDIYGHHWRSVTKDLGAYFIPFVPKRDHQPLVTGLIQQGYCNSLESIMSSIRLMIMRDIFLRLKGNQNFVHCGMGKLAKLADDTPPNICLTQPL